MSNETGSLAEQNSRWSADGEASGVLPGTVWGSEGSQGSRGGGWGRFRLATSAQAREWGTEGAASAPSLGELWQGGATAQSSGGGCHLPW